MPINPAITRAAGNEHRAGDERQFVIHLQEDHDSILQLDAFGLLRVEGVKLWDGDLFPGLGLLGEERTWEKSQSRSEECPAQK
jgi:hypothetical protein